jgi:1-acyl-sn-glycerol-3-phosphate acyltransferase
MLRFCFRFLLLLLLLPSFLLQAVPESQRLAHMRRYCRFALRIFGTRLQIQGDLRRIRSGLLVMNHLSWLDPLLLATLVSSRFVTSKEVEADPLLGRVCTKGGCVFVDRRSRRAVNQDQQHLAAILRQRVVTVFPEATSSNGEGVLRFKPAFFESARTAQVPVHLLALRYQRWNGRRLTRRTRDWIHWYGDMGFVGHLLRLLTATRLDIALQVLPSLDWQQQQLDRKVMAQQAHQRISTAYHQLVRSA